MYDSYDPFFIHMISFFKDTKNLLIFCFHAMAMHFWIQLLHSACSFFHVMKDYVYNEKYWMSRISKD